MWCGYTCMWRPGNNLKCFSSEIIHPFVDLGSLTTWSSPTG